VITGCSKLAFCTDVTFWHDDASDATVAVDVTPAVELQKA
jgi:hypothetical protein